MSLRGIGRPGRAMGRARERGERAFSRRRAISTDPLAGRQMHIGTPRVWATKVRDPGCAPGTAMQSDGDRHRGKRSD